MRFNMSLLLLGITFAFTVDHNKYPTDYFASPIAKSPLLLAGTFGELRPNHFHAGIDIKGIVGTPIYAAADGYVSKISVSGNGYGKMLRLTHPNGYTTLYAHLDQFSAELNAFAKAIQYEKESFELDLDLTPEQFPIKKGATIGTIGMTGATLGPHLHFEIQDAKTNNPINPLLFGLKVLDTTPQKMHQLKVYYLNEKNEAFGNQIYTLTKKGAIYAVAGDTLRLPVEKAGFGIKVFDHMNNVDNWNGIYSLHLMQDDSLVYQFDFETFPHSDTRYLNAHLDYEEQIKKNGYFNRCFRLANNKLPIYSSKKNDGIISLKKRQVHKMEITTSDLHGNETRLRFWIKQDSFLHTQPKVIYNYFLPCKEENIIEDKGLIAYFPADAFYENLYLRYQKTEENSSHICSPVYQIHNSKTPVHQYFSIYIEPTKLPAEFKNKAFIAFCNENGTIVNYGGEWKNEMLQAEVLSLGDYCVMIDTIAPSIKPTLFKTFMKGYKKITFKINDNIAGSKNVIPLKYRATLDGQWILMEYDAKNHLLTHTFEKSIAKGKHHLQLIVTDAMGNQKTFEKDFTLQ